MSGFNVQEFRSLIDYKGLMRNNKFLVTIPAPRVLRGQLGRDERELQFFCKAAPLPGLGILTDDVHRYGYGPINRTPYGVVFNDMMLQFYVDSEKMVRRWFRMWTVSILNPGMPYGLMHKHSITGAVPYEFGYKEDYAVDIRITAFDAEGRPKIEVIVTEAFPNYIGEVYQDWDDNNSHMIMPVSMTYRDWHEENMPTLPVPGAAAPVTPRLGFSPVQWPTGGPQGERG